MTEGILLDLRAGKWRCDDFEQHSVTHTRPTAMEEEVCLKLSLVHDWSRVAAMCLPPSLRTTPMLSPSSVVCMPEGITK